MLEGGCDGVDRKGAEIDSEPFCLWRDCVGCVLGCLIGSRGISCCFCGLGGGLTGGGDGDGIGGGAFLKLFEDSGGDLIELFSLLLGSLSKRGAEAGIKGWEGIGGERWAPFSCL